MKVKETLSPEEMDGIKGGGHWVLHPDGTVEWIPDDEEEGEESTIMW